MGRFELRRVLTVAAIYVAVMACVVLLVPGWRQVDWFVYSQLVDLTTPPQLSPKITIVDVPYELTIADEEQRYADLRAALGAVLNRIAAAASPHAGNFAGAYRPKAVILDVGFDAHPSGERLYPRAYQALIQGLTALQEKAGIDVYAALNLDDFAQGVEPDPAIYGTYKEGLGWVGGHVTGFGASTFYAVHGFGGRVDGLFYDSCEIADGHRLVFLPNEVAGTSMTCERGDYHVLASGPTADFRNAVYSFKANSQDVGVPDAALEDRYVLVGSPEQDTQGGAGVASGPEVLVWALNDQIIHRPDQKTTNPQSQIVFALIILTTLATVVGFLLFFRIRALRGLRVPLSLLGAYVSGVATIAVILWVLWENEQLYPQVTLPFLGVVLSGGLAAFWGRQKLTEAALIDDLRREREEGEDLYDVFISYSHAPENARWVQTNLVPALSAARLRVFIDTSAIRIGHHWYVKMMRSLAGSRFVISIYSDGYFKSDYCSVELEAAFKMEARRRGSVLPIMRGNVSVPAEFSAIQYRRADDGNAAVTEVVETIANTIGAEKARP